MPGKAANGLIAARFLSPKALCVATLIIAIALRIVLLLTSQSLPNGDESVTGLMAMHVLQYGIHPVYPYGVTYGAGAGVEIHLAAFLFRLFGCSELNLKFAGLIIWLLTCLLLYAVVNKKFNQQTACVTTMLYSLCPALSLYSLSVSGGHMVAVMSGLLALWLMQDARMRYAGTALLPVTAYLHPIAAPYAGAMLLLGLYEERKNRRRFFLLAAVFALACLAAYVVLISDAEGVHHPENTGMRLWDTASALATMLPWLFCPNINAARFPGALPGAVSLLWCGAGIAAIVHAVRKQVWDILFLMAGCFGVIILVRPDLLVPRHLLMLYPLLCILIGLFVVDAAGRRRIVAKSVLCALLCSGILVCALEAKSPYIYGAGVQSSGVSREAFHNAMEALGSHNIRYVYCLDPMLQWNIIFSSREKILARWLSPSDRVQRYVREIDSARARGEPVAVVYARQESRTMPQHPQVDLEPDQAKITSMFPPAR